MEVIVSLHKTVTYQQLNSILSALN